MAKFNAATAVDAMEYDFTAYDGGQGIIPEPSKQTLDAFLDSMRKAGSKVKKMTKDLDTEGLSATDLLEIPMEVEEEVSLLEESLYESLVGVTSGVIPIEDFKRLPYRVLMAFMIWLMKELSPESVGTVTKR